MLTLEHLADLLERHRAAAGARVREFEIAGRFFPFNTAPALMGVVNLSADSWYRESVCLTTEAAIERGRVLAAQGAAIIDVGAESTVAHAEQIDASRQAARLLPVVEALRQQRILVSIETYHPDVTEACLEAGANVLNLTGTAGTQDMYRAVAAHRAAVIICYVQGANVRSVADFDFGADPIDLMCSYFTREIERATACGVERILLDPGLGFYYRNLRDSVLRIRHQMRTFLNTFRLRSLGWPVCQALPHAFEFFRDEVRSAEPFFALLAALGRTDLFRTHEVPRTRAVIETLKAY